MKIFASLLFLGTSFLPTHHSFNNGPAALSDSTLERTKWKLVGLSALPKGLAKLSKSPFIHLQESKVNGFAGCNNFFGSYHLAGTRLTFSGMGSSRMFCQQGMDIEDALFKVLGETNSFKILRDTLRFLKDKKLLAKFVSMNQEK